MQMDVAAFDLAFFRSVIQLLVAIPIIPCLNLSYFRDIRRQMYRPLFLRSFAGALDYPLLCMAMFFLPVTITAIIIGTSPFWASLLAFVILGDPVRNIEKAAMVGSFVGISIITLASKGGEQDDAESGSYADVTNAEITFAILMAVLSSVCIGFITVMNR
mmetsp:Transcript_13177/g.9240  ORF Transcript_13177/g.9240 Transcript_13177/m.9240 type:complete len:160 (-) Transcript_13177:551-1030(-)